MSTNPQFNIPLDTTVSSLVGLSVLGPLSTMITQDVVISGTTNYGNGL